MVYMYNDKKCSAFTLKVWGVGAPAMFFT